MMTLTMNRVAIADNARVVSLRLCDSSCFFAEVWFGVLRHWHGGSQDEEEDAQASALYAHENAAEGDP